MHLIHSFSLIKLPNDLLFVRLRRTDETDFSEEGKNHKEDCVAPRMRRLQISHSEANKTMQTFRTWRPKEIAWTNDPILTQKKCFYLDYCLYACLVNSNI